MPLKRQVVLFMATKQIQPGDELTFDYCEGRVPDFLDLLRRGLDQDEVVAFFRDIFFERSGEMPCKCKAAGCKGYVFGCDEYWRVFRAREERRRQEFERTFARIVQNRQR